MRRLVRVGICLLGVILCSGLAGAMPLPADSRTAVVISFKDGHKQSLDLADVDRIELKAPASIVFKDGHQEKINGSDIARIDFETAASILPLGRNHFVGKWKVGEGNGGYFYITLDADGEAQKSIGATHGTWAFVDGEARISWDDGWHDAIRKVGGKHEKVAFEPGKTFSDTPSNVTDAKNTELRPI